MLSLIPWRYKHIISNIVSCDALVLCIKHEHRWKEKDISGFVFGAIYNIITMTETYKLGRSLLASLSLSYVSISISTLVHIGNQLQCYISVASNTLGINQVLEKWNNP